MEKIKNENNLIYVATINKIRVSPSKFKKYLHFLRHKSLLMCLSFLKQHATKTASIIWNGLNSFRNNYSKKDFYLVEAYSNKSISLKRIQMYGKGHSYYISKKFTNLVFKFFSI